MATKKTPPKKRKMSDDHKAALAAGREQGRAVRTYLEALAANKPKRGRRRTEASVRKQLAQVEAEIGDASPLAKLQLTQKRFDLEAELESMGGSEVDMGKLEADFIAAAAGYAESKKIGYAAFRAVGVRPDVLSKAGIKRGS